MIALGIIRDPKRTKPIQDGLEQIEAVQALREVADRLPASPRSLKSPPATTKASRLGPGVQLA